MLFGKKTAIVVTEFSTQTKIGPMQEAKERGEMSFKSDKKCSLKAVAMILI